MEAKHYFTPTTHFEHLRREPIRFGVQSIVPSILSAQAFSFFVILHLKRLALLFFCPLLFKSFSYFIFFLFVPFLFSSKLTTSNLMLGTWSRIFQLSFFPFSNTNYHNIHPKMFQLKKQTL